MFASGFWGMVPDGHWMLHEFGVDGGAALWRNFHGSVFANVCWFHGLIDAMETGRDNLEAGIALAILLVLVAGYYRFNDWTVA